MIAVRINKSEKLDTNVYGVAAFHPNANKIDDETYTELENDDNVIFVDEMPKKNESKVGYTQKRGVNLDTKEIVWEYVQSKDEGVIELAKLVNSGKINLDDIEDADVRDAVESNIN